MRKRIQIVLFISIFTICLFISGCVHRVKIPIGERPTEKFRLVFLLSYFLAVSQCGIDQKLFCKIFYAGLENMLILVTWDVFGDISADALAVRHLT